MATQIRISFPEAGQAERSRLASSLYDRLDQVNGVRADIVRERSDTQDPGTILSIVLAAPAVVLAVKAIAAWAMRNNQPSVLLELQGKTVMLQNLNSADVPKALDALKALVV